jgi:hypothetical protein
MGATVRKRLARLIHEHGATLVIGGFVIVTFLAAVALRQSPGVISAAGLNRFKDDVDFAGKLVGLGLAVFGAMAAYHRFFKGRVLEPRLKLGLSEKAIIWATVDEAGTGHFRALLHSLDVELENVGAATLWEPEVSLKVRALDSDEEVGTAVAGEGVERRPSPGALSGVGPGEVVTSHYRFRVPEGINAFRVSAEVAVSGNVWHRSITVANRITPADPEEAG